MVLLLEPRLPHRPAGALATLGVAQLTDLAWRSEASAQVSGSSSSTSARRCGLHRHLVRDPQALHQVDPPRPTSDVLTVLRTEDRVHDGRDKNSMAAVVDPPQSRASRCPGHGFRRHENTDVIKHHILVDTAGRLLAVHATAVNIRDRARVHQPARQAHVPEPGVRLGRHGLHRPSTR